MGSEISVLLSEWTQNKVFCHDIRLEDIVLNIVDAGAWRLSAELTFTGILTTHPACLKGASEL